VLGNKTITSNGVYFASEDEYDGYSKVVVDVEIGGSVTDTGVIFIDYDGSIV